MIKKYGIILLILFFSISLITIAQSTKKTLTGYLSDALCFSKGTAADGTNMLNNPEKHTVACMKMIPCAKSGYGILVLNKKTSKYEFYKFDDRGNQIIANYLAKTTKKDNISLKVTGIVDKMTVKVETIEEIELK